jgi:branched-chain amino acid transport system permease protein
MTTAVLPSDRGVARVADHPTVRRIAVAVAGTAWFLWVIHRFFGSPLGVILQGVVIGAITSFIAFGIALIYRSSRIINFAQGDLGGVPASFGVLLMLGPGASFFVALPVALAGAVVLGAFVEFVVLRRFFKAPRLILTVVTIGLSQILAGLTTIMPNLFDLDTAGVSYRSPIDVSFSIGSTVFDGNEVIAMLAVPIVIVALTWFLRSTSYGIAIRAAAESSDRAALLGVPVKRVQTVVWVVATLLSAIGVFMRAGILGLPIGSVLGPTILIRALTAAIVGRMERLPTIFVTSIALGVLEATVIFSDATASAAKVDAILFAVVLAALLLQRHGRTARGDETSTWQAANNIRPIPRELVRLPEVRWGIRGAGAALVSLLLALPLFLSDARVSLAATIVVICIVTVSLVVLTGWAGQVSLGQVAFMGIGAAVGSWLTVRWDWDLSVVILACGVVGAVAAMLIGIPALRIRGLFLAVATLAFAIATSSYVLNKSYMHWLPDERISRNALFGRIAIDTEPRYYYLCLACLFIAVAMVRGIRNSRAGRVLIGVRDNERGAQAYGINVVSAKLTAFAVSGFLAAAAGALFVHGQQSLGIQPYAPARSFQVFILVVIGGLGSIPGALLGPVVIEGLEYFRSAFPEAIRNVLFFFTTGVGLIMILLFLPGGFGQVYYGARDRLLRAIADRRGIHVPSLVADLRTTDAPPPVAEASITEVDVDAVVEVAGAQA